MKEEKRNQFAFLLKYYLMMNGKRQNDLAADLGFDKSTVSSWCSGARIPKLDVIIEIADYLHVEVGDLIVKDNMKKQLYYLDDETAKTAQEIYEKDKVLFDAYRSVSKDRLIAYAKKLDELSKMEEGDL